ncbi:ubiquitin fusion degradation 1 [Actinidia rufa]|uniref:Ubiquitin fusion degradation 1 n=1 Tax=Actinidia rufa TaxID=165716 RepID=A0A7J0FMM6_9ERIC|nr:ubiquitin fusion degradation 1 [Actinidia rufa]
MEQPSEDLVKDKDNDESDSTLEFSTEEYINEEDEDQTSIEEYDSDSEQKYGTEYHDRTGWFEQNQVHNDEAYVYGSDSTSETFIEEHGTEEYSQADCFEQQYYCYPLSHINKSHLEDGNRIIMPLSAFDRLAAMRIEYPMVFEIKSPYTERVSHCGVLEFSAEEGFVLLPDWMMKNLKLEEGQLITLKNTTLPKGTYMKIQPHSTKFLGFSNPKSMLETTLKNFSCLTFGDTIVLNHDHNSYYFDILETKPSSAISVVETDCEVGFAVPLDYKETEKKKTKVLINPEKESGKSRGD